MRNPALRLIAAVFGLAAVALGSGGRVLLVSLDGLGYRIWAEDRVAEELKTLRRVAAGGVAARGVVSTFPSLTAPAHASIWTGAYGDVNGVAANDNLVLPRSAHSFTERRNGFRSESLMAEPLWVTAARQGVRVVAHQPPQAYPFGSRNTAPGAVVVNCYQTETLAPDRVLRAADVTAEPVEIWKTPRRPGRAFRWSAGGLTLHAALAGGTLHVAADPERGPRIVVRPAPAESEPPRRRPLARRFSAGLPVTVNGEPGVVYFRLFDLRADGSDFLLYQSPLKQTGIHGAPLRDRDVLLEEAGGMVGNGAHRAYMAGALGKPGRGLAERRYLETLELSVRQFNRYSAWLWARYRPRLLIDYSSVPDEFEHAWLGYARCRGTMEEWRRWGYAIVERRLERLAALAAGDSFIVSSDHGMGAFDKEVRVNVVLERAGLRDKAVLHAASILLNTAEWRGGVVPPSGRDAVLEQVRAALAAVRDPDTGRAVFTRFVRPGDPGAPPGLGGASGGDIYFDLAPGYRASPARSGGAVARLAEPVGAHGLDPERPDMLAVLFARGPKLPRGREWPRLRTIDIAPLVADLLGIAPPAQARGKSPLN